MAVQSDNKCRSYYIRSLLAYYNTLYTIPNRQFRLNCIFLIIYEIPATFRWRVAGSRKNFLAYVSLCPPACQSLRSLQSVGMLRSMYFSEG